MQGLADRQVDHNRQKKAAVINDFTSFGRCSLAVTIPILSAMKVQCCPVPTAFFTNHTGFDSFAWTDNTPHLDEYIAEWRQGAIQVLENTYVVGPDGKKRKLQKKAGDKP